MISFIRTATICATLSTALLLGILISGCGERHVESTWRDREITIDGVDGEDEWSNARYFLKEQKLILGVMNDDDFLYLRLSSLDPAMPMKVILGGLAAWLDESGKSNKDFAVLFPIPVRDGSRSVAIGGIRGRDDNPTANSLPNDNQTTDKRDYFRNLINNLPRQLLLLGEEKEVIEQLGMDEAAKNGIQCALGLTNSGNIVYELSVPLKKDDYRPYGISENEIETVGLTFQTGKVLGMGRNNMRNRMGGPGTIGRGDAMGGMGGMGGMRGGGTGSGGLRNVNDKLEPLEIKFSIKLARP